jgi:hypothetical protein
VASSATLVRVLGISDIGGHGSDDDRALRERRDTTRQRSDGDDVTLPGTLTTPLVMLARLTSGIRLTGVMIIRQNGLGTAMVMMKRKMTVPGGNGRRVRITSLADDSS